MPRKNVDVIHDGKQSWWDGSVKTVCGLRFPANRQQREGFFASVTCPACKAAKGR